MTSVTSLASPPESGSSQFSQDLSESPAGVSLTTALLEMQTRDTGSCFLKVPLNCALANGNGTEVIESNTSKTKSMKFFLYIALP